MVDSGIYGSVYVVGIMDQLWFHQALLFAEPNASFLFSPNKQLVTEPPELSTEEELESSSDSCPTPTNLTGESSEIEEEVSEEKERPTRANTGLTPTERRERRSYSSSPAAHSRPRKYLVDSSKRLEKSMSCRSLADLEMEEVRGFMDLGFIFKREHLSPRMFSLVPGLHRLAVSGKKQIPPPQPEEEQEKSSVVVEDEEETPPMRPYLSEAWLIRSPDSPLLNLRVPTASPAAEVKQHLRFWARAVASLIEQES